MIPFIGLAGINRADQLYGASIQFERQLVWLGIAWPVMLGITTISYRPLKQLGPWLYLLSLIPLVIVLFMPPI